MRAFNEAIFFSTFDFVSVSNYTKWNTKQNIIVCEMNHFFILFILHGWTNLGMDWIQPEGICKTSESSNDFTIKLVFNS